MRLVGVFLQKTRQIEHKQMLLQWGKFADGFPNLFINDVKEMAGKDGNPLVSNSLRSGKFKSRWTCSLEIVLALMKSFFSDVIPHYLCSQSRSA